MNNVVAIGIEKITEQETAHPSLQQLSQLTGAAASTNGALENITVSHEIEERAAPLIDEEDEEDEEKTEKEHIDEGAFQSEPVNAKLQQPTVFSV